MSTPADALASGLVPADRTLLNLDEPPVLKKAISPVDRSLTEAAFKAYQGGNLDVELKPSSLFSSQSQMAPIQQASSVVPSQTPPEATLPLQTPPPEAPQVPPTGRSLTDAVFGPQIIQDPTARVEAALVAMQQKLDSMFQSRAPAPPANPYTNQYNSSERQEAPPAPGADFVSRQEMQFALAQARQEAAAQAQLANAHIVSRMEAERLFPDVFSNPVLRDTATDIWSRDRSLQADPRGVMKAALMARGMSVGDARAAAATATAADVRKVALAGVGPSVAEGNAQPNDQATRYAQALAYASKTGQNADFVRALQIRNGTA